MRFSPFHIQTQRIANYPKCLQRHSAMRSKGPKLCSGNGKAQGLDLERCNPGTMTKAVVDARLYLVGGRTRV